jgi:hypothetical protein
MHRLFSRVPKGLDPVADVFREHVDGEGMKLVKEAASAAETKKEKEKDGGRGAKESGGGHEQAFVRAVIALHDKYAGYVADCFANSRWGEGARGRGRAGGAPGAGAPQAAVARVWWGIWTGRFGVKPRV